MLYGQCESGTDVNGLVKKKMSDIGEPTGLFRNSSGPEFVVPDEESISTCPLLTPSPTMVEFQHPLALSTTPGIAINNN